MSIKFKNWLRTVRSAFLSNIYEVKAIRNIISQVKINKLLLFPSDVIIELTNACNLECIMCPRKEMNRSIKKMEFNLFKKIIDDAVEGGARRILPFFFGEPFMQSDIGRYLSYIRSKSNSINISILTNGILLDDEKRKIIYENRVNAVAVSLDAATMETYEIIRKNGDFRQAEENVKELIHLRKEKRASIPFVAVQFIVMNNNRHEIDAFKKKWEGIADSVVFGAYTDMARTVEPFIKPSGLETVPCFRLWNELVVCNDGKAALCCNDWNCSVTLGDMNNQTISEIWNSRILQDIRDNHHKYRKEGLSLCSRCYPEIWDSRPLWWH